MWVASYFYDCCILFNCANCIYYQEIIEAIASISFGYKGPSYDALRVKLLAEVKNIKLNCSLALIEVFGMTRDALSWVMQELMVDIEVRSIFFVYCPKGSAFIKYVDASAIVTDVQLLCNLFYEIIDMVDA